MFRSIEVVMLAGADKEVFDFRGKWRVVPFALRLEEKRKGIRANVDSICDGILYTWSFVRDICLKLRNLQTSGCADMRSNVHPLLQCRNGCSRCKWHSFSLLLSLRFPLLHSPRTVGFDSWICIGFCLALWGGFCDNALEPASCLPSRAIRPRLVFVIIDRCSLARGSARHFADTNKRNRRGLDLPQAIPSDLFCCRWQGVTDDAMDFQVRDTRVITCAING